jgi:hypothetical protein
MTDARQRRLVARLDEALAAAGTHTLADVIALANDRRAQIWEGDDALIVTELNDYPLRRMLRYWCVAGTMDAVRALQPRIDAWAIEQGATRADAIGRRGWERVIDPEGWRHVCGYWIKDLQS